jgi:hypothetical protein
MGQSGDTPLEKGISSLLSYHEQMVEPLVDVSEEETKLPEGQMDVFTELHLSDYLKSVLSVDDLEKFSQPILHKTSLREKMLRIENLFNEAARDTQNTASEIINDIQTATFYPPTVETIYDVAELVEATNYLSDNITLKQQEITGETTKD